MIRKVLAVILVAVAAAILLVAVWPQLLGLQSAPVIAQVVSLRGVDIAIALALAVLFGLIASAWRGARRFLGTLAGLLLVFSLVSVAILGSRGFGGSTVTAKPASDVTVLSWNTEGGKPGPTAIAELALAQHADVITLPETTSATGTAVERIMAAAGHPMWIYWAAHGNIYESHATTLLISAALGKYTVDTSVGDTSVLSSIIARPNSGTGPTIVAVHAVSPKPDEMRNWHADLEFLARQCTGANLIMAGDFNATTDALSSLSSKSGADFGECSDAGLAAHAGAIGSWPTSVPALLGAQIDHVMYTSAWKVAAMEVIQTEDAAGSDHRPIVATLAPAS
ncbi:MAG TPA: endonuclease/exonuclease/phosphatase family protein [Galbitalea sp.]|nr:endonuclease/exonuclease/phosphatase family protein [Galbitalea sp.]